MLNSIENFSEFDKHVFISYIYDEKSGLRGFIAIHRNNSKNPSFGATRYWNYKSEEEALKDVLRLSKTMSYKSALAGLPYGGAKATLIKSPKSQKDHDLFIRSYANKVNLLGGHFLTGTDIGITDDDVKKMRKTSKNFVGIKTDPARYTALGVFYSLDVVSQELFGNSDLSKRSFAIQGVGKVGSNLLKILYPKVNKIIIADIDKDKVNQLKKVYPNIKVVDTSEIATERVDFFCPCALNNCINWENINNLKVKAIVGSANNQLEDEKIGIQLYKKDILYAPDYVVNAGGLISVVDEYENNNYQVNRTIDRVKKIKTILKKVIDTSKKKNTPPNLIAIQMAEQKFNGLK